VSGDTHKVTSSLLCWFFITDGMFYLQSVVWGCSANLIDVFLLFPCCCGFHPRMQEVSDSFVPYSSLLLFEKRELSGEECGSAGGQSTSEGARLFIAAAGRQEEEG
jgi:hypothetical protein